MLLSAKGDALRALLAAGPAPVKVADHHCDQDMLRTLPHTVCWFSWIRFVRHGIG